MRLPAQRGVFDQPGNIQPVSAMQRAGVIAYRDHT